MNFQNSTNLERLLYRRSLYFLAKQNVSSSQREVAHNTNFRNGSLVQREVSQLAVTEGLSYFHFKGSTNRQFNETIPHPLSRELPLHKGAFRKEYCAGIPFAGGKLKSGDRTPPSTSLCTEPFGCFLLL